MGDSEVIMGLISNDEVTDDDKISLSNPENGCPTGTPMADLAPLLTPRVARCRVDHAGDDPSAGDYIEPVAPCGGMAGASIGRWFVERGIGTTLTGPLRVVVTESTTIQEPGSPGTTWRMHAQWNLAQGR